MTITPLTARESASSERNSADSHVIDERSLAEILESQTAANDSRQHRSGSYVGDRLLRLATAGELFSTTLRQEDAAGVTDSDIAVEPTRRDSDPKFNRRSYPRRASECVVSFHCGKPDEPVRWSERDWRLHTTQLHGSLRNISMSGMAFSTSEAVDLDEVLMLRIGNPQLGASVDVVGRVVRVTRESDQSRTVFLRFEKKLRFEQISPLRLQFADEFAV